MELGRSGEWLRRAERVIAGGVNSNVRLAALPQPLFFERGQGAIITDVDGNDYLDFVLGQGPLIHGHGQPELLAAARSAMERGMMFAGQHDLEVELAERICRLVPSAERVRIGSSGSEMVQAAFRIARAATGRSKIVKFEGHYHGWFDNVLISVAPLLTQAGPREAPVAVAGTGGQSTGALEETIVLPWNDADVLESALRSRREEIAAVITEPVMCNVGCILPAPGYLQRMRALCDELGIVLIFDEVITGFRLAPGGAQEKLGVLPDLCTFGKAMAGGFPIACLAGRKELMESLTRGVNHSGTYNANLLVAGAAVACLDLLTRDEGDAYARLYSLGERLRSGLRAVASAAGADVHVQGIGPVLHAGFGAGPATDYRSAQAFDVPRYHRFALELLRRGVRVIERGLWYVSTAHTERDIDTALEAAGAAFAAAA